MLSLAQLQFTSAFATPFTTMSIITNRSPDSTSLVVVRFLALANELVVRLAVATK